MKWGAICSLLVLLISPRAQDTDDLLVGSRLARSEEAEWDVLLPTGKEEESCRNL